MGKKIQPRSWTPRPTGTSSRRRAKRLRSRTRSPSRSGCWTSVSRSPCRRSSRNNEGLLLIPCSTRARSAEGRLLHRRDAQPAARSRPRSTYVEGRGGTRSLHRRGTDYVSRARRTRSCAPSCSPRYPGRLIAEEYTPFNDQDDQTIVGKIKRFSSGGNAAGRRRRSTATAMCPSTRNSANQGLRSENAPIMAFSGPRTSCAAWTPHPSSATSRRGMTTSRSTRRRTRSSSRPSRRTRRSNDPSGGDKARDRRSDGSCLLRRLHLEAGRREGEVLRGARVRKAVYGQEFLALGGKIKMDEANHHTQQAV